MRVLGLEPSRAMLMASTCFRGGGGGFHAQCGALNAGIMNIGLVYGRTQADEDNGCASEMAKLLCQRFLDAMGHLNCDVLRDRYQCRNREDDRAGAVYYTGAKLTTEVILGTHQRCTTCGGFDGALGRLLASEKPS